jgi:acetoin utilization deacetylase AcuC-like enzyme
MYQPLHRVLFYDDPLFLKHDAGSGHPERPERLHAVRRGLTEAGLLARLVHTPPRPATTEELLRVHTDAHVARVLAGVAESAFCAVRPPGHHAESDRAMGFCLFNNVAVGAAQALHRGVKRVLIIDWDVHHGNGTQEIFYEDPRVLYVSSHAYPFYPGTGSLDEMGEGAGTGFTVNLPLPIGTGDRQYARLYRDIVAPVGRAFAPQLVLVSVGFDPHALDPLAGMILTERGFGELTDVCLEIAGAACGGRIVFVLEGGYDMTAIAASSAVLARRLLGETDPPVPPASGGSFEEELALMKRELGRHWPVLKG